MAGSVSVCSGRWAYLWVGLVDEASNMGGASLQTGLHFRAFLLSLPFHSFSLPCSGNDMKEVGVCGGGVGVEVCSMYSVSAMGELYSGAWACGVRNHCMIE